MKSVKWRLILVLAVLAWALFQAWPREERPVLNMRLGLDLKGGSHLVLEVVTDDAVKAETDLRAIRIGDLLRREGFTEARSTAGALGQVIVTGIAQDRLAEARTIVDDNLGGWSVSVRESSIRALMPQREQESVRDQSVRQALTTITNRIDQFGVAEPIIQRVGGGSKRILLQLPGVEDPSRVKNLIQTQAQLELRLAYYAPDGSGPFRGLTREQTLGALGGQLRANRAFSDTDAPTTEVVVDDRPGFRQSILCDS
ncbi:MAG: hypothetical protein JSV80_02560, partial [Acidobacteriota bacterium]